MLKRLLFFGFLFLATASGGNLAAQSAPATAKQGVLRVKLQREVAARLAALPAATLTERAQSTGVEPLDRAGQKVKAVRLTRVFPYSPKFEERHKKYGLDLWYEVRFDSTAVTPAEARAAYQSVPGVEIAETVRPVSPVGGEKGFRRVAPAPTADGADEMPFNDPLLPQQWHYHNTGTILGSVAGADANVFEGWKIATGTSNVLVAVIDGGVQYDHPDLAQNMFVNEAELNGQPGVDDDGNGYTDDVYGYNFVINSADVFPHDHGTHVAGTVGAVNNNGIGVAGVAGGNGQGGVKMLSCQIFDTRASSDANYAAALVYAADMGAAIAQCSWGWSSPGYYEQAVLDAIDYFTAEGGGDVMQGGLCIFANGNTGDEGEYWPACYEPVVAVGAMTCMKTPASYSTRGTWCDVTAPGGDMDYGQAQGVLSTLPNGTYGYNEGTSMACPHVSGIAALVLSKYGNPQFPNSTLRQQLVSSVNDLYTDNPEAAGLFGSGYIDADKALHMSTGEAPAAVTDFTLTPSQDNVLVEWTIPQTPENSVDHHVIYYSTSAFTADNLEGVMTVNVDTKFNASGDKVSHEVGNLKSLTTYYFALQAVNRWGQASALSEVRQTQTNAGPTMTLDQTAVTFAADAAQGGKGATQFTIQNTGAGILKYDITTSTASNSLYSAAGNVRPGKLVPYRGMMGATSVEQHSVVSANYRADDYPKTLTYSEGIYRYIGESDLTLPNALAQYFYVDPAVYPDGFNLTALRFGGYGGENPVIEIYNGSASISTASLLQKVDYSFFGYNFDLNLKEQLYFAPGSAFWVVAKFPAGQNQPLGVGLSTNDGATKQYSFYSCDGGNSWTQLSEVLREADMTDIADVATFDVYAVSKNPDWSSVLVIDPQEGTVRPGESQEVKVENDGQKLVNGTYKFNLFVNANEDLKPQQKVQATLTVSGYAPELASAQMIDFGDLLVGQEKTLDVEIVNNGYGDFTGQWGSLGQDNIASSSDQFKVPTYAEGFSARSTGTIEVTFAPTRSGSHSGTITLTDAEGHTYNFIVRGVASNPAKASLDQTELDFGELEVGGEAKTATFTITNEGEYPLQYVFPKFSDETIEGSDASVHRYGYSYLSNLNGSTGFAYDGNPDLAGETDVTSQINGQEWQSDPVSIGFDFPFYGQTYDHVYITSYGGLSMQTIDGNILCMVPTGNCVQGLGYISPYVNSGKLMFNANSKVTYGRQDGKFVVKYKDVLTAAADGGSNYVPISYHVALCDDGSVEIYYDDYDPYSVFGSGENNYVGVSDIECDDPMTITDANLVHDDGSTLYRGIQTGTAFKIVAPAKSFIAGLSSTSGLINIGEKKTVTVTVQADETLYAGNQTNLLTMITNDPASPSLQLTLRANVTGDGLKPVAVTDSTSVDFGHVFRTSDAKATVLLRNTGNDTLRIAGIAATEGHVQLAESVQSPFKIAAGSGRDIIMTLPTETEGAVTDLVVISFEDGQTIEIPVKGTVIGVPGWSVAPASIEVTTPYGTPVERTLTVTNTGNEPLTFTNVPNPWVNLMDQAASETSEMGYAFKSRTDFSDIAYNWIDLTNDPEAAHQDMTYYLDKTDFYTVELPFEFPFYGKSYRTMYIYNTGFVSFSEHEDYKMFPEPPMTLPDATTFYTNIIAPFWGNHSMNTTSEAGTYYKSYGDHVVVSYVNYGNSMMIGMDFQVILYKDGRYKFQYHLQPTGLLGGIFGLAGYQDETGTRGLALPEQYIADGNAVEFYPTKRITVPAGGQVEMPLQIVADSLGGNYSSELTFNTNVPTQPVATVPLTVNVEGEPAPVWPESVGGEVVSNPNNYAGLEYEFAVVNNGSRAFTITDIESELTGYMLPASLMVYTTYFDYIFGTEVTGWTAYTPGMQLEVGLEPVRFKVMYYDAVTIGDYEYPMTFHVSGLDTETVTVPFRLSVTEAPVIGFDQPAIEVSGVPADYTGEATMHIRNTGNYKLTYSLRLDPNGVGETLPDYGEGGGGVAPAWLNTVADSLSLPQRNLLFKDKSAAVPHTVFEGFPYDVPPIDCNSLLYYPILDVEQPQSALLGAGDTTHDFYAATRYVAPEGGFNLSHLYFYGTVGDLENVDIEATIVGSSDVTSDRIIGRGTLRVDREEPYADGTYVGAPRLLEFDRPVYINPADTFYVVLKYPAGYPHSAMLAQKADRVESNRFMAWFADLGWIDVAAELESQYGSMGFFMTCVEMEAGSPWIKLLTQQTEGEVAVGGEVPVTVAFDASRAYFTKGNKAVIVIKSNDPAQPIVNYPVTLNLNGAPVINAPETTPTVPENATADVSLTVADEEGEAFSVVLTDESGIASLAGCTLQGAEGAEPTVEGNRVEVPAGTTLTLTVRLAPAYGTAGSHSFALTATDQTGNSTRQDVIFNVEHVNRGPQYVGPAVIDVAVSGVSGVYTYDALFTDPDGDDMAYHASMPENAFASLFTDPDGFIVNGRSQGETTLTLTATDALGLSTSAEVKVNVSRPDAIGSATAQDAVTVSPNPVKTVTSVTLGKDAQAVTYRLYDPAGKLLLSRTAGPLAAGTPQRLDLSGQAPGTYYLEVTADGERHSVTLLKK